MVAFAGTVIGSTSHHAGLPAAHFRGWFDDVVMMLADAQAAVPFIIVALTIIAFFGTSLTLFVVVVGLYGWQTYARLARAMALTTTRRNYIRAVVALGASPTRVYLRHVLPNAAGVLIVNATIGFPEVILLETALSFLGLGIQPPLSSLGSMLELRQLPGQCVVDRRAARYRAVALHASRQPDRRSGARSDGAHTAVADARRFSLPRRAVHRSHAGGATLPGRGRSRPAKGKMPRRCFTDWTIGMATTRYHNTNSIQRPHPAHVTQVELSPTAMSSDFANLPIREAASEVIDIEHSVRSTASSTSPWATLSPAMPSSAIPATGAHHDNLHYRLNDVTLDASTMLLVRGAAAFRRRATRSPTMPMPTCSRAVASHRDGSAEHYVIGIIAPVMTTTTGWCRPCRPSMPHAPRQPSPGHAGAAAGNPTVSGGDPAPAGYHDLPRTDPRHIQSLSLRQCLSSATSW